jgi:uncharacterized membrane protein
MEYKKFIGTQMFKNSWEFIKEQLNIIDTWFFITFMTFLANLCLMAALIILVGIIASYFAFNASAIFDFTQKPYVFILSLVGLLIALFLLVQIIKKIIGFLNINTLNSLDVALGRSMRRFDNRDERLSFITLTLLIGILTFLGGLFLIVPGIFFMVRSSMAYPIILEEKCSPLDAISKSFDMTRGNFWPLSISIGIFAVILWIPFVNLIFIFVPIHAWNFASLYAQLKNK